MSENKVMSVGDWVVTILVASIPLVGFIMLFVWAFGDGSNPNKQNWAKAALIFFGVMFVLYLLIFILFLGALAGV